MSLRRPVADQQTELQERFRGVRHVVGRTLLANILLVFLKLAAGIVGRSQALVADAVHSLSDLCTDAAIFVGVKFWTRPPDESHPHGHARIETLIGAVIGVVIAATGIGLGFESIHALEHLPRSSPGWPALAVALLSVFIKEWLYRWTRRKGIELRSSALAANAWHQRTDAFSSIPVVIAVSASILNPSWAVLDVVGGLVVSVFIVVAAWKILRPALDQLVDTAPSLEIRDSLRRIAMSVAGVQGVHKLRSRYQGNGIEVDMHVVVDGGIPVTSAFMICRQVEERIKSSAPGVIDVVVRTEPAAPCGDSDSCALFSDEPEMEDDPGRDEG
jgi:cation diffusion facilitator family transporter